MDRHRQENDCGKVEVLHGVEAMVARGANVTLVSLVSRSRSSGDGTKNGRGMPRPPEHLLFQSLAYIARRTLLFAFAARARLGTAFGLTLRLGIFHHLLGFLG